MADQPFCRLTVLSPRHRVDVALPADVPVAELVPLVLELVGEPERGRAGLPRPWRLSGVAGGPLPAAATLSELGVLDGELLRLGPAAAAPAAPVFHDPVDALAAGAQAGAARGHRFETAAILVVVLASAALLAAAGPGSVTAALPAGAAAAAALTAAAKLVRREGDRLVPHELARSVALGGVALGAAAGWNALPAAPVTGALMAAAVAAGIVAAGAQLVLRVVAPALVAAGVVAVVTAVAVMAVRLGATPVAAATAAAAAAIVGTPLLPRAALRLAGLPRPVVPADGSELTGDDAQLPAAELAERGDLARGYLAGLTGGASVIAAAGALVAAFDGGWSGPVFAVITTVVLLLRARGYADTAPARTALAAGVVTAVGVAVALAAPGVSAFPAGPAASAACAVLLLGAATGVVALDAVARGRRVALSPVARRSIDLAEGAFVAASVPLALAAMDLFRVVRGW
ncbi:MAG TPA: type VII secretion integral membrane protein EccD [Pseudonocardia sp.]